MEEVGGQRVDLVRHAGQRLRRVAFGLFQGMALVSCLWRKKQHLTHWPWGDVVVILMVCFWTHFMDLINILNTSCEITLKWMPQNTVDDNSTLVQVMARYRQATSHYLHSWTNVDQALSGMDRPYGLTWPQGVKHIEEWTKWLPFCRQHCHMLLFLEWKYSNF